MRTVEVGGICHRSCHACSVSRACILPVENRAGNYTTQVSMVGGIQVSAKMTREYGFHAISSKTYLVHWMVHPTNEKPMLSCGICRPCVVIASLIGYQDDVPLVAVVSNSVDNGLHGGEIAAAVNIDAEDSPGARLGRQEDRWQLACIGWWHHMWQMTSTKSKVAPARSMLECCEL